MGVDAGALIIAAVAVVVAIIAALYSRQQAHSASDSAASAVRSADAANEQVAAAREQVTLGQRQLELAEKIRKEQSEPYVVVDVEASPIARGFLVLVIENIGTTVARNVRFDIDPPLRSARKFNLPVAEAKILKDGIPMLPPKRRLELLFDFGPDRFESSLEMVYSVTVYADGPHGHVEPMRQDIDISVLYGWHPIWSKGVHEGVEALRGVQKELGKMQADLRTLMQRLEPPHSQEE
ncbi:hypothetical protein [Actinomadura formosensis]|uniref:hypothetical protein n=1 Tax=Actinomadura formosensis TaxID=60706 RepID=UPI000833C8F6|nr:hypothetical protein [Actinomadura formosensis]